MTEKEFDIQVRNLLQNAEETVSPKVWKGVSAGLDTHRRIVPWYAWGGFGVVAAAAAAALFVLLKPSAVSPVPSVTESPAVAAVDVVEETQPINQPIFMSEEQPGEAAAPSREKPLLAQASTPAAPEETASVPQFEDSPAVLPAEDTKSVKETTPVKEDNSVFNKIAFEENKQSSGRGFSFNAFGNMQANNRSVSTGVSPRRFGVPILASEVGIYNESAETSFGLPFSLGLGVTYNFSPQWAVGTGIRYSFMQRSFLGDYQGDGFRLTQTDIVNRQHWLGVPVNLYYNFVNSGRWSAHAVVGGTAEWLLDNDYLVHNSPTDIHYHNNAVRNTQLSIAGGIGVEYRLSPAVGLYLEPTFRYYFSTQNQPRSIRTVQPLRFEIEAGLRFNLGK